MDIVSHALWGYGFFGYKRYAALAILFGAMPDLISFGAFTVLELIHGTWQPGAPPLAILPGWIYPAYSFGHSFVVSLSVIGLVSIWRRDIAFAMLAWPFHILLDFPFHSLSYFATPVLWPFSDYRIDGIPWSHWYIWYPNIAGLAVLLYYRYRQKRKLVASGK